MALPIFGSEERQHSPSVFQVAELTRGKKVADFCYLSNKFFPTREILAKLSEDFEAIVRNYPSMQPEQRRLAGALTGFASDQILVGNGASDIIAEAALAIEMGALADDLGLTIHAHPTLPEAIMQAAKASLGEAIHIQNR